MKKLGFKHYFRLFTIKAVRGTRSIVVRLDWLKVLLALSLAAFLISACVIGYKLISLDRENRTFEEIRQANLGNTSPNSLSPSPAALPPDDGKTEEVASTLPYDTIIMDSGYLNADGVLKIYEKNHDVNPDMIGWITMPGYEKAIDYPVMQSSDNLFYLHRDFYKNKSFCGSIFMDVANRPDGADRHIILYGHSMREKSMFGNLMDYPEQKEEFLNNTRIFLDLMDTRLEYKVFSAYYASADYDYRQTTFKCDEDYQSFLNRICAKSFHDFGTIPGKQDRILTLSTCNDYSGNDDRTVIHARLIRQTVFTGSAGQTPDLKQVEMNEKDVVSANMYLHDLQLEFTFSSDAAGGKVELNPPFRTENRNYSAFLPADARILKLTCTPDDPNASLFITMDAKAVDPDAILLTKKNHTLKITVTSQDGKYERTYKIELMK